jgi:hypothetical protein
MPKKSWGLSGNAPEHHGPLKQSQNGRSKNFELIRPILKTVANQLGGLVLDAVSITSTITSTSKKSLNGQEFKGKTRRS